MYLPFYMFLMAILGRDARADKTDPQRHVEVQRDLVALPYSNTAS